MVPSIDKMLLPYIKQMNPRTFLFVGFISYDVNCHQPSKFDLMLQSQELGNLVDKIPVVWF